MRESSPDSKDVVIVLWMPNCVPVSARIASNVPMGVLLPGEVQK